MADIESIPAKASNKTLWSQSMQTMIFKKEK